MIWVNNNWIDKSLLIVFCAIFLNTICSSICNVNAVDVERTNDLHSQLNESLRLTRSVYDDDYADSRGSSYERDSIETYSGRSRHQDSDSASRYDRRYDTSNRYNNRHERLYDSRDDSSDRYNNRHERFYDSRDDSRDRYNNRHGRLYDSRDDSINQYNNRHKRLYDSRDDSSNRNNNRHESHYDSRSHGGRHPGKPHAKPIELRRSSIKMPSGDLSSVTDPYITDWRCGRKAKLISFHANGRTAKREYELIANEMEKTKIDITGCANRGGCYKSYKILRIQKIVNGCLWKRYQDQKKDMKVEVATDNERLLFHGSTSAAMWDIVNKGIDERNTQAGVYGAGLYFTDKSTGANELVFGPVGQKGCPVHNNKSCTICERQLFICRVNLGKEFKQDGGGNFAHAPVGHHSVVGKHNPTMYTEYIVYRAEQVYPEYLITYKIEP